MLEDDEDDEDDNNDGSRERGAPPLHSDDELREGAQVPGGNHPFMGRVALEALRRHEEVMLEESELECVPNTSFCIPSLYLRPLRLCAVNQHATCLSSYDVDQYGPELVFVGIGEAIPQHFQLVFWLMEVINRGQDFTNFVVPVSGRTRLTQVPCGKRFQVTGVEEVFRPPEDSEDDGIERYYEDWPKTDTPIETYAQYCRGEHEDEPEGEYDRTYVATRMVRIRLGIIPIEYQSEEDGEVRTVAQVLRVSFAPGFHGLQFINERILSREHLSNMNKGEHTQVQHWCSTWKQVMNYEASVNLGLTGLRMPSTSNVRNLVGPLSVLHLLSPFNVLERILNNLHGGYCGSVRKSPGIVPGTLRIHGFPDISQPHVLSQALGFARRKTRAYQALMTRWCNRFVAMRCDETGATLPRVLPAFRYINASIYVEISLGNSSEKMEEPGKILKVVLPPIIVAIVGYFLGTRSSSDDGALCGCSLEEYIAPHVQNGMGVVTHSLMDERYVGQKEVVIDVAQGGMFSRSRLTFLLSLQTMRDKGVGPVQIASSYKRYLSMSQEILLRIELMKVLGSERVHQTAKIITGLVKNHELCGSVAAALGSCWERVPADVCTLSQRLIWDQEQAVWHEFLCALCVLNESARMNSMNITALLFGLVADVFTFLGTHNTTWIFKQFTTWVMGGNGHFRTAEGVYTLKRNSSGLSSVVLAFFNFCLLAMSKLDDIVDKDKLCLDILFLVRVTAPTLEKMATMIFVNGKLKSAPSSVTLLRATACDELFRNMNNLALHMAVLTIPRGTTSSGLSTVTADAVKDEPVRAVITVQQMPGMSQPFLFTGTNANPNHEQNEPCKSMITVMHTTHPGAPRLDQSADPMAPSARREADGGANKKRKQANRVESDSTEGISTEPADRGVHDLLAWALSVLPAVARRVALHNKLGQCDFEINDVILRFFDWVVSFVSRFMPWVIGSTITSDFQRIMQGYLAHGVGVSLLITVAKHLKQPNATYTAAVHASLSDMESSAMGFGPLHTVLITGLTRVVDTNLLCVNQLIRRILGTPVLDLDWLCATLCGRRYDPPREGVTRDAASPSTGFFVGVHGAGDPLMINRGSTNALRASQFLNRWMGHPGHMDGGFVLVPGLGDHQTYVAEQLYLERYISLAKGQYPVYKTMILECGSKSVELEVLLNEEDVSLRRFCAILGVPFVAGTPFAEPDENGEIGGGGGGGGGGRFRAPGDDSFAQGGGAAGRGPSNPSSYLFVHRDGNSGGRGGSGTSSVPSIKRSYVNLVAHLLITAIQGNEALHAENSATFASNLYRWILRRYVPIQFVPNGLILAESFRHSMSGVEPLAVYVENSLILSDSEVRYDEVFPEYMMRPMGKNQLRNQTGEFRPVYGPYLPEDAMHMGAWVRQCELLLGGLPSDGVFRPISGVPIRSQELRPTRVYPVRDAQGNRGTVCVCPFGMSFTLLIIGSRRYALELENYQTFLWDNDILVGPLVHRANAVVRTPETQDERDRRRVKQVAPPLGLILPRDDEDMFRDVEFELLEGWEPSFMDRCRVSSRRYFMDVHGNYLVRNKEGHSVTVHFDELNLVPLGTPMRVEADLLRDGEHADFVGPHYDRLHIEGWLRYPDECSEEESRPDRVYVLLQNDEGVLRLCDVEVEGCGLDGPGIWRE